MNTMRKSHECIAEMIECLAKRVELLEAYSGTSEELDELELLGLKYLRSLDELLKVNEVSSIREVPKSNLFRADKLKDLVIKLDDLEKKVDIIPKKQRKIVNQKKAVNAYKNSSK